MNRRLYITVPAASTALIVGIGTASLAPAQGAHTQPEKVAHTEPVKPVERVNADVERANAGGHLSYQERRNTKAAIELLDIAFNKHKPGEAARRYISARTYIQHNPDFGNGREAFIAGVSAYVRQFPNSSLDVRRTVTQGSLVVVQGLSRLDPQDRGTVSIDTFRFNREGKAVEHWDALQKVAETSKNGNPQV